MEQLITVRQTAELLNVSYITVLRLIYRKKIEAYHVGRSYRLKLTDIQKYLFNNKNNL